MSKHPFSRGKDPWTRCDYCARRIPISQTKWDWLHLVACFKCWDPYPGVLKAPRVVTGELTPVPRGRPDYLSLDGHEVL
jgi:hypothetical protein